MKRCLIQMFKIKVFHFAHQDREIIPNRLISNQI